MHALVITLYNNRGFADEITQFLYIYGLFS